MSACQQRSQTNKRRKNRAQKKIAGNFESIFEHFESNESNFYRYSGSKTKSGEQQVARSSEVIEEEARKVASGEKATTKAKPATAVTTANKNTNTNRRKIVPKQKPSVRPEQKQQPQQQTQQRARGTLHGLSTLRRHGNVRVTPQNDYIAVRSNFVLGPLVLKVEKPYGRGTKREVKRATATTTQMIGRINLRIVDDKATLHSIKVQQPKQV